MAGYPHPTLTINNREVPISRIQAGEEKALTPFEQSSFALIHDWLAGKEDFILNTSGSTGTPKEITVSRDQMALSANLTLQALALQGGTALVCLSTTYIAGKMMIVRALLGSMKILALEPCANPLEQIDDHTPIDFAAFVPMQLQTMLSEERSRKRVNSIRQIIVGGAPIPESLNNLVLDLNVPVYATYGMTETLSHIALKLLNGPYATGLYKTLPGITVSTDERSCLVIHSPLSQQPIETQDMAEVISPQTFKWLGRWDNVINSGGFKIIPEKTEGQIEKTFQSLGLAPAFFLGSLPDPILGEKAVLCIEGNGIKPALEEKILEGLRQYLHPYEIPKKIISIDKFILTPTGKVNRKKTLEHWAQTE